MADFWEETLRSSVKIASGYAGSYSMTRTIGRALSWGPLKKNLVMVVPVAGRLELVADGSVDIGWSVPAMEAKWAFDGIGPGSTQPLPNLRGIARFPQVDRFMAAAAPWSGITRLEQIAEERRGLSIAVRVNPGPAYGWFENKIFSRYGFTLEDVVAWGGRHFTVRVEANAVSQEVAQRSIDLVIGEASTQPIWPYLATQGFRFFGLRQDVVDSLVREDGLEPNVIPAGFLPGIHEPLLSIDESDFLLVARADAAEQLTYEVAKIVDQNRKKIEEGAVVVEYAYTKPLPLPELVFASPLTGPLQDIWNSPIPLHPGAAQYFTERGYL